ncbi:Exo endo phos domain-containing protein [Salix suchowensis]|nr:Exo endo phos domain-containing protein [Salix suchowensis]
MSVTTNIANPTQRNEQRKATGQQGQLNGRKTPVSWAEKVKVTNANSRFSLEPLARPPPGEQLVIPEEAMEDSEQWSRCLVGFFPGYKFPYHAINSMAMRVWKSKGLESVTTTANGFILFRFKDQNELQGSPRFQFDTSKISSLLVWIRLRGLPIPLWSIKALSMVASMVGTPLSCDEATHKCTRLEYARICVEIDASLPYVHQFQILTPLSPTPITIHVDYEWKPARCNTCKVFGHACVEKEGIITEKENQGSKEGNDMSVPVIQHEERADKRMPEHTTKGRNDMQFNPNHNHPLNQTIQIAGSSHVLKPHRPMQSTTPKVKTAAHPAEAHKNSHPAHLNNNPDPEIAEPTDWNDTTASSAKEKDTALIRAKGKGPLHAENNSNTILEIGISNEDTGDWNIWGLNSSRKQKAVREWTTKNNLDIIGLLEVKIASSNMQSVVTGLGLNNWDYLSNGVGQIPSRILIGWNKATCNITYKITFKYGHNSPPDRLSLWSYISHHSTAFSSAPWLLMGDFNAVMERSDRSGGSATWLGYQNDFGNCMRVAELMQVPYTGLRLTWHNGRTVGTIKKKLDWTFRNAAFFTK